MVERKTHCAGNLEPWVFLLDLPLSGIFLICDFLVGEGRSFLNHIHENKKKWEKGRRLLNGVDVPLFTVSRVEVRSE